MGVRAADDARGDAVGGEPGPRVGLGVGEREGLAQEQLSTADQEARELGVERPHIAAGRAGSAAAHRRGPARGALIGRESAANDEARTRDRGAAGARDARQSVALGGGGVAEGGERAREGGEVAADRIGGIGCRRPRNRVAEGAGHRGGLGIRDEGQGDARAGDLERRDHGGLHAGFAEATTRLAACGCHAGRTSISMRAMAQGKGQLEIQLGHLCNNRCVFCVSGQLTSRGEAPFLPVEELYRALDEGWAAGNGA